MNRLFVFACAAAAALTADVVSGVAFSVILAGSAERYTVVEQNVVTDDDIVDNGLMQHVHTELDIKRLQFGPVRHMVLQKFFKCRVERTVPYRIGGRGGTGCEHTVFVIGFGLFRRGNMQNRKRHESRENKGNKYQIANVFSCRGHCISSLPIRIGNR